MPQYPHPIVGIFIVNSHHEVLLVQSPKWEQGQVWAVPGGHVEWGETIARASQREAMEEVGLKVKFDRVFEVFDAIFPPTFHQTMHFIFLECLCRVTGRPEPQIDQKEISAARWFTLTETKTLHLQSWTKKSLSSLTHSNNIRLSRDLNQIIQP